MNFRNFASRNADFDRLEETFGIVLPEVRDFTRPQWSHRLDVAMDAFHREYGMDAAQPGLVTTTNAGIPAFLANFIDPKFVEVLVSPMKAAEIIGESKKGDWTTMTAMFPIVESTGEVSSYGDYSNNGEVGANINFEPRQSYFYQTITEWGERELAQAGLAKIDMAARKNIASALIMNKFQNKTYFFGVQGLTCYGLLNDPSLPAAITPMTKTGGGNAWSAASLATEVYQDIETLFAQLVLQTQGLVNLESKLTLAMSPTSQVALTKTTQYNVNVMDLIKKNFPNLRVVTAVEYATASGQLLQLIADEIEGQEVASCSFNEKMRAHSIVKDTSSFRQKKSGGTWGAIIKLPIGIAQMLGV